MKIEHNSKKSSRTSQMKILARPVLDFQETANYKAMKFKPFLPSVLEAATSKELAQKRCARYLLLTDRKEIAEQCPQSPCFGIFGHIAGNLPQQRFGIFLHHSQIEKQR